MAKEWIIGNETAKQMLARVVKERPLLLLPHPLHRVPLSVNNIVEIAGPSPSAKTEILIQMVANCILPKDRNGVEYGGLERPVLFIDLDCRLDVFRLSQILKLRIAKANKKTGVGCEYDDVEVFKESMNRFSYTRCYNSFEFLAALKTLRYTLEKGRTLNVSGKEFRVLMIDNIGAFYWIDRGLSSLPQRNPNRKNACLQTVFETVVNEISKLLLLHPMLVLATKTVTSQVKSSYSRRGSGWSNIMYREYMPSIWQSFVTHRILVRASNDKRNVQNHVCYLAEWLLPALNVLDEFVVVDSGIFASI
ncbi:DNA repair protein XRCC2 homolog [Rutidosis leptorrhynchoides]|uniref:DNA repair protein XRCC2 homolog n=1 Tax=Rutidosis leptorrhynchoides TaxID=125765 RepID=UPI003A9A4CB2